METNEEVKKYVVSLTALTIVAGIAGWLLLKYMLPQYNFPSFFIIPAYFYLIGLLIVLAFKRFQSKKHHKLLLLHSGIRMMKMMVSIVFLIIFCLASDVNIKEFLLVFVVFYLIYLVFETIYFFNIEHDRRKIVKNRMNDNSVQ